MVFADAVATAVSAAWQNRMLMEMPLCKTKQNIVSTNFIGNLEADPSLVSRLWGHDKEFEIEDIVATHDEEVSKKFPGFGKCAFLAGWLTYKLKKHGVPKQLQTPYVLVEIDGNPAIIYDERFGSGEAKYQIAYVMIAKARENSNDILLM